MLIFLNLWFLNLQKSIVVMIVSKLLYVKLFLICCWLFSVPSALGQSNGFIKMHSHNDYHQNIPFWKAISCGFESIEVDVLLQNDSLFVTHQWDQIIPDRTLENLYLQPLKKKILLKLGEDRPLQLLIDIKSDAESTLKHLVALFEKYPQITQHDKLKIVISGNRPPTNAYSDYPDFIYFDHQNLEKIPETGHWEKVALISLNFKKYASWNGRGEMDEKDRKIVEKIVHKAHSMGRPFRFWGIPDTPASWKLFATLGVDYINTDDPIGLSAHLKTLLLR
jgi:alkaline phosphatase